MRISSAVIANWDKYVYTAIICLNHISLVRILEPNDNT